MKIDKRINNEEEEDEQQDEKDDGGLTQGRLEAASACPAS